jgi:type IV secretion system protein VirB4
MLAKKQQAESKDQSRIPDFIPFACHYSDDTILTKNGELIQFIKIDQDAGANDDEFRQAIRDALNAVIDPSKHAVWTHTTRSMSEEKELISKDFTKKIELAWRKTLPKKLHFENAVYISIVIDSAAFKLGNPVSYLRALSSRIQQSATRKDLAAKFEDLSAVVDSVQVKLRHFGAKKLKVYEDEGVFYSEPMEFLRRILSFYDDRIEMPLSDLSYHLAPSRLDFNEFSGVIEVFNEKGKHYACVISLKECGLLPARSLDYLLNIDGELVISQSLDFASANTQLHTLKYQEEIDKHTEDTEFAKISGLSGVDSSNPDNFVLQQTNIILMQDSPEELRKALINVQRELSRLGLIGITEDIRLEKAFWSVIPGNFSFMIRQDIVPRKDIANFALLGNDLYQEIESSLFGDPIIFFENQDSEPFPFHLINNGSGHMLITSEYEEQRDALLNLLGLHLKKFPCKIVYYDEKGKYENIAKEMGAEYITKFDLEYLKKLAEAPGKLIILFNSLDKVVGGANEDFFNNFLEFLGENDSILIACARYAVNHVSMLVNFDSQIYFGDTEIRKSADNFDLFDDEIKIIMSLQSEFIYAKHNYEEIVLKYQVSDGFVNKLLGASSAKTVNS